MVTRRRLTLVAALLVAGALAFPSTAAPLFTGPTDPIGDGVELVPSSDYAYLEEEELVIDVSPSNPALEGEGLNPDGRTTLGNVFRIQYTGSMYAHVWLTHDAEGVTFSVDGQPIGSRAANVTLAPNESVPVSMTVNTTADADGYVGDIDVHARVAEPETETDTDQAETVSDGARSVIAENGSREFTLLSTSAGDPVELDTMSLTIDRSESGTLTLEELSVETDGGPLLLDVETVDSETASAVVASGTEPLGGVTVTVESGSVQNATLEFSASETYLEERGVDPAELTFFRDSEGDRSRLPIRVTDEQDGRVTFSVETQGFSTFVVAVERPELAVTDVRLDRDTVAPGETVSVSAVVTNEGRATGEREIVVTVDGQTVAERTVAVAPGTSETVTVDVAANTTGEHVVAVEGTDRGTFEVESATDGETATATSDGGADEADTEGTDTAAPVEEPGGFGLSEFAGLLGLLVIVAALLALGRRVPRP